MSNGFGRSFEAEVRRVAEAVWGLEPGACQPQHYEFDPVIRELDGIARLPDLTHLIMATSMRDLKKVKDDVAKLLAAEKYEKHRDVAVAKWLITLHQLEAQHIDHAKKNGVKTITLQQFRARCFDGRDYIQKRKEYPFGSVRNFADGTISVPSDEFVALPMTLYSHSDTLGMAQATPTISVSIPDICTRLLHGEIVVMMAPFGSGKSLSTREIFYRLSKDFLADRTTQIPVALNLREHWGMFHDDVMLYGHARKIGFSPRERLTSAWRAGMVVILIDGFDEVASQTVVSKGDRNFLREARLYALQGLKDLLSKAPAGAGILVCGRDHYFDDLRELTHAIGISGRKFARVQIGEFTEDQAKKYLQKKKVSLPLPEWLPRKPLLLGYLAHQNLLEDVLSIDSGHGFGHAWDEFLRLICEREASHQKSVMDATTLRHVLERLATDVRATMSGTGPITGRDLADVYLLETGQNPEEGVIMQLQRLPGLTQRGDDSSARGFIDEDILAALQGSAVAKVILENMQDVVGKSWHHPLSSNGIAMASHLLEKASAGADTALMVGRRFAEHRTRNVLENQIAADCLMIALELATDSSGIDCHGLELAGLHISCLNLEELPVKNLKLVECIIDEIIAGPNLAESTLFLDQCLISKVVGIPTEKGLPESIFDKSVVEHFDPLASNSAILKLAVSPGVKALLTILRKLYRKAGSGRQISALKRGIPAGPVVNAIEPVVKLLESAGIATVVLGVVHPNRSMTPRVNKILDEGAIANDDLVERSNKITV